MAIGPVQLIVLGFEHPDFHGEIIEELERLRESDTVRVIDALAVYKDAQGDLEVEHLSNLTEDEAIELGSKVAALIGLGIAGEEGMEAGAEAGAEAAAETGGMHPISDDEELWDVLEDIPNDTAAALILIEHQWAVPLRDADRPRGRLPAWRRVHQSAGSRGDRSRIEGGCGGAPRHGEVACRRRELAAVHPFDNEVDHAWIT